MHFSFPIVCLYVFAGHSKKINKNRYSCMQPISLLNTHENVSTTFKFITFVLLLVEVCDVLYFVNSLEVLIYIAFI